MKSEIVFSRTEQGHRNYLGESLEQYRARRDVLGNEEYTKIKLQEVRRELAEIIQRRGVSLPNEKG